MSRALTIYLVDLATARAAVASHNDKLRRMIGGRFKEDFARADHWFSGEIAQGAPTRHDALKAVIEGGPFLDRQGFQYGYAYEMIVRHFGKYLNNNAFSPFRGDWLEQVDRGLAALKLSVRVTAFYGTPPSPIPPPDEVPGYGEWSHEQCAQGLVEWDATTTEQRQAVDPEVLSAITDCVEWMRATRAKPGLGVAGFFF